MSMSISSSPYSCDTFVVLAPLTDSNFHIFGKNSDRPATEVQEIIFVSNDQTSDHPDVVQCSHIRIPQVPKIYRCILSKPAWCWGAEMGANEHGLCIGNEAVFSKIPYGTREKALTGLDIVRLTLERCKTARTAVDVIGSLVEHYGQGGPCFDASSNFHFGYDNSFLLVDPSEAWTIETCDRVWVAKHIKEGFYNMSNVYAIADDYDLQSKNLEDFVKKHDLWHGEGKLHFAQTFQGPSPCTDARWRAGRQLLENLTKNGNFSVFDMISILRDDQAGICVDDRNRGVKTTSSQVSVLKSHPCRNKSVFDACHFLTGTPNPRQSLFKPFLFTHEPQLGPLTVSTPYKISVQRIHALYAAHQSAQWNQIDPKLREHFEHQNIRQIIDQLKNPRDDQTSDHNYDELFHRVAATEIELLRENPL